MQDKSYFIPNDTFDNAIRNNEKGVIKALLIGIIGSDPTFATTEYDEATAYVKSKSAVVHGASFNLSEPLCKKESEYEKSPEDWDEEYYRMLLVWYRDNYADERLSNIKAVGKEVYKNKPTLGKSKRHNRMMSQKQTENYATKKAPVVMATGNDRRTARLPISEWFKQNWKWIAAVAGIIAVIAAMCCLFSSK